MEPNEAFYGQYKHHVRKRALFPMAVLGAGIVFIGFKPNLLFHYIAHTLEIFDLGEIHGPHFYTFETVKGFLIPFTIGSLIYVIFVRGKLLKEVDGKHIFVNPSLSWIELERDVYRPVIGFLFVFSSTLLKVADRGLIQFFMFIKNGLLKFLHVEIKYQPVDLSTKSSEFVSRSIEAVRENREQVLTSAQGLLNSSRDVVHENRDQVVVSSKSILNWSKDAYEEVVDRSSEQTKNMREIFMLTGTNLNSLVYTVLTFVFVLVMILVLMVTK